MVSLREAPMAKVPRKNIRPGNVSNRSCEPEVNEYRPVTASCIARRQNCWQKYFGGPNSFYLIIRGPSDRHLVGVARASIPIRIPDELSAGRK
jgi:hypothetical protein